MTLTTFTICNEQCMWENEKRNNGFSRLCISLVVWVLFSPSVYPTLHSRCFDFCYFSQCQLFHLFLCGRGVYLFVSVVLVISVLAQFERESAGGSMEGRREGIKSIILGMTSIRWITIFVPRHIVKSR